MKCLHVENVDRRLGLSHDKEGLKSENVTGGEVEQQTSDQSNGFGGISGSSN